MYLGAGQSTTVTFDVIVAAGTLPGTVITNTARVTGTGEVSGLAFEAEDSVGIATPPAADLSVVKTTPATFTPGRDAIFTIVMSNAGPTAVTVIAPDATTADALATAASVLGAAAGATLVANDRGVSARFVWQEGDEIRVATTPGWPGESPRP